MAALVAAVLPAVPGAAHATAPDPPDPIYRVKISIRSTADAVRISLARPGILIRAEARRSRGERLAELQRFGRGPLVLARRPGAGRARATFVVALTPRDAARARFRVRTEGSGTAVVRIRNANVLPARPIASLRLEAPGTRRLVVRTARLAARGPVPGTEPLPPSVLAFYYPWYQVGDWAGGMPIAADNVNPTPYDSADPATIDRHIQHAMDAGIDGFIVSWWGGHNSWDDNVVALEERIPPGFTFALYLEVFSPAFRSEADLVREIDDALDRHGASEHYLRIGGRPVVYVFSSHNVFQEVGTVGKTPRYQEIWRRVLDELARRGHDPVVIGEGRPFNAEDFGVFDGMHVYGTENPAITLARNRQMALTARAWAAVHGGERKIWGASIIPGYDDRHIPDRKPDYFPRLGGALYEAQWASATASHADQALIVSFNEWMETTNIEPNAEWGDQYLGLTAVLAARF
ncbi:MAG: hypothetical protein ACRDHJ_10525, partial [Actinomycetota bacterium]